MRRVGRHKGLNINGERFLEENKVAIVLQNPTKTRRVEKVWWTADDFENRLGVNPNA